MRRPFLALVIILLLPTCTRATRKASELGAPTMKPPTAPVRSHTVTLHGDTRKDDYHWLRNKDSDEVTAYLQAENAYTAERMRATETLQKELYDEIVERIDETDQSAPFLKGDFEYYYRTEEGLQYRIHCRRRPGDPSTETVLLDMNELARGKPFLALGLLEVSPSGRYLAFSLDETGFREYTLYVKDLDTGQLLDERIQEVKSVAWATDSRHFLYTVDDETKRPYRVKRHRLGTPASDDPIVYQEDDERFRVAVWRARSGALVFRGSFSHTTSEIAFADAGDAAGGWRVVEPRRSGHEYDVAHRGETLLIRTNDAGRSFRVVRAPIDSPGAKSWKEIVPHRADVMIEGVEPFEDFVVLVERERGLPYLRVIKREGEANRIALGEPVYSLSVGDNEQYGARRFRFRYESLATPDSVFDYDVENQTRTLVKRLEVRGGYDPNEYRTERLWAAAADGTEIPVSVVYREGTPLDGTAPMLLVGYGAYGYPYPTTFSHARVSLLDRGFVYAIAHVRGGGELGKRWHDQGRMEHKINTFTDFIAVAEHLVERSYTSADRLAVMGGSAGGLLMGAVANMRPELFNVVVALVPFVDILNTMLDESLPLTVGEYEEWGNPHEREAYFRIKSYCPYSNVAERDYPTMLVRTSLNDSQVMYWEPAKYVAKLRAHKTDSRLLLFRINMEAGHGGASGRYDYLEETAFDYAFILEMTP